MSTKPQVPPPPSQRAVAGGNSEPRKTSPRSTIPNTVELSVQSGRQDRGQRILEYGPEGIGKTWLAAHLPGPLFLDVDDGSGEIECSRIAGGQLQTWSQLRSVVASLQKNPPEGVQTIVVDTTTAAELLAKEHVIQTRPTERDKWVDSIEGYGWGKGWQFVFDEFEALLADMDRLIEVRNMNVCLIAHAISSPVPNPDGEDFIRWEPHLYDGDKKGRGSIRARVKGWCDHILFLAYDINVAKGKAQGEGSRSIYTYETATHIAKSRRDQFTMPYERDTAAKIWERLGIVPR